MNVFGQFLDDREARRSASAYADDQWLRERAGIDSEERLELWRRWLGRTLETSLQWPKEPAARARLIGQCVAEITVLARQLRGRGWLLDGKALAGHVRALLAPIGAAQRAGAVRDFWPYFRAAVARYVGSHAEEIQAQARRTGCDEAGQTFAQALAALGLAPAAKQERSLVEVISHRGAAISAAKASKKASDTAQLTLI